MQHGAFFREALGKRKWAGRVSRTAGAFSGFAMR
jgi:hypothetical protein